MATIDDLLDRWEEAREHGDDISPEELCADHPELLPGVKAQIEVLLRFESSFGFNTQTGTSSSPKKAGTKAFEPPLQLSLSSRYRLQGCHAVGGLGQVFLAFDEVLQRRVAIKFPKLQGMTAQQMARFEQEARITGQLDHPGIVPIHAMAGDAGGEPCYVMRFVEGRTLDEAVRAARNGVTASSVGSYFGSEDFRKLVQSLIAVCNTIAFAHDRKILHRDIKPNNILIGPFGETLLLDWGIAKPLETVAVILSGDASNEAAQAPGGGSSHPQGPPTKMAAGSSGDSPMLTEPGHSLGTPAYASPEQLLGRAESAGFASDIYSLGATLLFIITGQAPLEILGWGNYIQQLQKSSFDPGRLVPSFVPTALRAICVKCLQLDPTQRYLFAQMLAQDLDDYLVGNSVSVLQDSWWTRMVRLARRHPTLTGGTIATMVVLSAAGAIGTAIVGGMNQQLSSTNEQLAGALEDSREANTIAMASLRSMVHESVSRRMTQREELTDSDRAYIRTILQQYLALATLQGNTEQTLAIRAEAEGQVGSLYFHLFQHEEAIQHLKTAQDLYRQLRQLRQDPADSLAAAGYMEVLAAIFFTDGRFQESRDSSDEAITLLDTIGDRASILAKHDDDPKVASALSSLLIMRGEANQRLEDHDQARQDFREAAALLQQLIASRPDDVSLKFVAGNNLRTFASYLNERATTDSERQEALSILNQSISYMESARQNEMNSFRYLSTLAWSYYDRSFVLESLGRLDDAISDMWKSVELTEKLKERFPLMNSGRQRLPGVLARRCRLFLKAGKTMSAYTDARNLSDLKLTRNECSMAIELIQRCLDADDSDSEVDREDAICHIAHLHAQRGSLYRSEGDLEKALADAEEAIRMMASLADAPVSTLYRSFEYIWSLERIEVLLLLGRLDQARPFIEEASNRRDAVRNLYDESQLKLIDAQLESFRSQLKSSE